MTEQTNITTLPIPKRSIIVSMSERYGMEPKPFEDMMRAVALPKDATEPEFASCMMVAHGHNLNPITREIFFMRTKSGTIQPIVSIDGWIRKCNEHPQYDGIEFEDTLDDKGNVVSITGKLYRKDRSRPTIVTEYMAECRGQGGGWQKTPTRMLRHRVHIQGARYAFGFAGIMDQDEFDQWQNDKALKDITPKPALAVPDIPDAPPTSVPAAQVTTAEPDNKPDIIDDKARFLIELESEFAKASEPDILGDILMRREDQAKALGVEAEAQNLYDIREKQLTD